MLRREEGGSGFDFRYTGRGVGGFVGFCLFFLVDKSLREDSFENGAWVRLGLSGVVFS